MVRRPAPIQIPPRDLTQERRNSPPPTLPNLVVQEFRKPPRSILKIRQALHERKPRTH